MRSARVRARRARALLVGVVLGLCVLAATVLGSSAFGLGPIALAQEAAPTAPNAPREARFEWDANKRWLFVTVSYRDVADAALLRKLTLGLPTTIILTGLLYAQGNEQPLASTLQNCKITWHVWEEMYRVEVSRPDQQAILRHWTPTLNGVLRRCAQTERLLIAQQGQVGDDKPLIL
ncbi:MAG TPA: hypothetical protein VMG12_18295, partial [Polyangiaceae bacterium]|nr:hypothetical protein [Polyangiaceae bacterium]